MQACFRCALEGRARCLARDYNAPHLCAKVDPTAPGYDRAYEPHILYSEPPREAPPGEPGEGFEDGAARQAGGGSGARDAAVAALRRFAELGGCPYREPCGCKRPRCAIYGHETDPAGCVECIESGRNKPPAE